MTANFGLDRVGDGYAAVSAFPLSVGSQPSNRWPVGFSNRRSQPQCSISSQLLAVLAGFAGAFHCRSTDNSSPVLPKRDHRSPSIEESVDVALLVPSQLQMIAWLHCRNPLSRSQ